MTMPADNEILESAAKNQKAARAVIRSSGIAELWKGIGAEINLVGSLNTGLLMTHRDIDFHIYTEHPIAGDGLNVMKKLSESGRLEKLTFTDGMATEERCLEYHAWYRDDEHELWQFDMIHIEKGSRYDGWAENIAEQIKNVLTPETRLAILRLKYLTPPTENIMGIEYCHAVLEGGVRTYPELLEYRKTRLVSELMDWVPSVKK